MAHLLPLMRCWRITADALPPELTTKKEKSRGFSLPGLDSLKDFADLIGETPETDAPSESSESGAPFSLPAMLPDSVKGCAALSCTLDFGTLRGDCAVLTFDHIAGRGRILLDGEPVAAFDSISASYRSINEAFDLTGAPCMLAVDLQDAPRLGKKQTLTIAFDETRPAGVSGPVMLRIASGGFLSRVSVSPDARAQTMTIHVQINALRSGVYTLSALPVDPGGMAAPARCISLPCEAGVPMEATLTLGVPAERFVCGAPYRAPVLKLTLVCKTDEGAYASRCDSVTLLCGYPGKAPQSALPLTPKACMQPPQALIARLSDLHIPAVRLPIPAPDALYRALTAAGIFACMNDSLPLRARLERLPCSAFAAERIGEYADVSPEASAWQMNALVQTPRAVDPSLTAAELLEEAAGQRIDSSDESVRAVLMWLRAVSVRMRAEAARQGRYTGALCAPDEWDTPDIADALRTAFAPLHISLLPLRFAWWSSSRFSASVTAFVPPSAYTSDDPLIVLVTLEDEDGQEIARLGAPCRHTGGYIGLIEAMLPEHACVLSLNAQLTLHGEVLEYTTLPVYVGQLGVLEAAFR